MKTTCQAGEQASPDDSVRVWHSRAELTKKNEVAERGGDSPENPILATVLEIPGVVVAQVNPYALVVRKAATYSWKEISPAVSDLVAAFNLGEGKLIEKKKESEDMNKPDDISSAELGNGYVLKWQEARGGAKVRAIVKAPDGSVFLVGPTVDRERAWDSKMAVLTDAKSAAWTGASRRDEEPEEPEDFDDFENEEDDEDDEGEEDE